LYTANDLHMKVTDDSCKVDLREIVSKDTGDSCSSECVDGDCSAKVKLENGASPLENSAAVKTEPVDVCCAFVNIIWDTFTLEVPRWLYDL